MADNALAISVFQREINSLTRALTCVSGDFAALSALDSITQAITDTITQGKKILVTGNGGFAAVGQHFISELMGRYTERRAPIAAISLDSNPALITCIANDFGYERIYSRQIQAIAEKGDIILALTASGRSKNILEAANTARNKGVRFFAITGSRPDATLSQMAECCIALPSDKAAHVQDTAMCLLHAMCMAIEESIPANNGSIWQTVMQTASDNGADTLLLDRDGVINTLLPNQYVTTPDMLHIENGFLTASKALAEAFSRIIIVSNQACVGKGIVSEKMLACIHQRLTEMVERAGGRIDAIYYAPDAGESSRRKPATGMALDIEADFPGIDFTKAVMVGDSYSDQLFAERIGATYIDVNANETL